ncbi:hypothetical protein [Nonomuraea bangladeshensis]|uniref:hypothetical protein n=1 Tax=Nonomuraea bangladeshensis TaxID=404385 RepID=UPI003C2D2A5C
MRALIIALALALVLVSIPTAYRVAWWIARARRDRKDLALHQDLIKHIHARALKHQELGDHFAVIVADDIDRFTSNNALPKGTER